MVKKNFIASKRIIFISYLLSFIKSVDKIFFYNKGNKNKKKYYLKSINKFPLFLYKNVSLSPKYNHTQHSTRFIPFHKFRIVLSCSSQQLHSMSNICRNWACNLIFILNLKSLSKREQSLLSHHVRYNDSTSQLYN